MAAPWQTITSSVRQDEEHVSVGRRTWSWWKVDVTTLTLACGHQKVYRGSYVPTKKVRCQQCPS